MQCDAQYLKSDGEKAEWGGDRVQCWSVLLKAREAGFGELSATKGGRAAGQQAGLRSWALLVQLSEGLP